jgi:hypothetical protein
MHIHLFRSLFVFEILPGSLTPKLVARLDKIKNKKSTASKFPVQLSIIPRQQKRIVCCFLAYTDTSIACMKDALL